MSKEPAKREIKQERAARTRIEILEAAITLFARRGYLSTTMSDLAKAIRMTPGALYWHFPTKEDLLLAAIDELHQRYLMEFTPLLAERRTLSGREQLVFVVSRTSQFLRYHREYGIFFGMLSAESAEANDRVTEALREKISLYVSVLAGMIRYGQKRQEFRPEVDPVHMAHTMMGGYLGILLHHNLYRDTVSYDPLMASLDQILSGDLHVRSSLG
ncbi:TetR/AcrR family transcriptional regulator [Corallococcus sp. RDP092CA]|uniref:TetR/AcrR family transcriptional regulator n=1 Tax=Corallococcus sp. RDP092CA TaxID=3109369 RepID=UPI0035B16387